MAKSQAFKNFMRSVGSQKTKSMFLTLANEQIEPPKKRKEPKPKRVLEVFEAFLDDIEKVNITEIPETEQEEE